MDGTVVHEFISKFIVHEVPAEYPYLNAPLVGTLLLHFCRWLKRNSFTTYEFNSEEFGKKVKKKGEKH